MATLSIVIPVYNEQDTLHEIVARVVAVELPDGLARQVVLVDDGSTDASWDRIGQLPGLFADTRFELIRQDRNRGKGAALRAGFAAADGEDVIVQDADLEYDPADYAVVLAPLLADRADVVYGSRFAAGPTSTGGLHYLGNRVLTRLSNWMTGLKLTDMETCYKAFRGELLRRIEIRSSRFEVEPELTAKIARLGARVVEVPISYAGRGYAEGKKITWVDGVRAIWTILRYRFAR